MERGQRLPVDVRRVVGPRLGPPRGPGNKLVAVVSLLVLAATPAGGQGTRPASDPAQGRGPRDLSGIWEVKITAGLVGTSLLCRVVPELSTTELDTVPRARNLKELIYAVIPDTSIAWFDSVCEPVFSGDNGEQVSGDCLIPLVWASPCNLEADLSFEGALDREGRFTCIGLGDVSLGGPGLCPKTTCPGEILIVARRVGAVP
jgi:hypothetical protein